MGLPFSTGKGAVVVSFSYYPKNSFFFFLSPKPYGRIQHKETISYTNTLYLFL